MAEMRDYMPTDHRRFINAIREHSTVRKFGETLNCMFKELQICTKIVIFAITILL